MKAIVLSYVERDCKTEKHKDYEKDKKEPRSVSLSLFIFSAVERKVNDANNVRKIS